MKTVKSIPEDLKKFINKYFNLDIAGHKVVTPYFINLGRFLQRPVYAGKADPYEIESVATQDLANHKFIDDASDLIREEMKKLGIGIDCSGLVYQILNKWLRDIEGVGELKDFLPEQKGFNVRKIISRKIKPESSVSADMFTSEPFSKKIEVKDIRPGDLIRTRGGKHLLLVTDVEYESDKPVKITFINSADRYQRTGVRYGYIMLDDNMNLMASKWTDENPEEENFAYKGFRELSSNNGVFRPQLPLNIK